MRTDLSFPFMSCYSRVLSLNFLNSLGKVQQDPVYRPSMFSRVLLVIANVDSNQLVTDCILCVLSASPISQFTQPPRVPCLLSHFPLSLPEFSNILLLLPPPCSLFSLVCLVRSPTLKAAETKQEEVVPSFSASHSPPPTSYRRP